MEKKFTVLIEDDWELSGNGLGNVASHQYLPSLFFMKLAKKLEIKLTFMVDVAQQLVFEQHAHLDPNIKLQKKLWDDTVLLMKEYGFDVQLHLHPQWHHSVRRGDLFYLSRNWNIGRYDSDTQNEIVTRSVNYLHHLIRPFDKDYQVIAFKGGSWGLQPSESLFEVLTANGIKMVMGPRQDMYFPENGVNYRGLEESTLPYYPQYTDIRKVSGKKEGIVIIPLQSYKPDLASLFLLAFDDLKQKLKSTADEHFYYQSPVNDDIKNLSPLYGKRKMKFKPKPYHTHLKIGNQPFSYLKKSFDVTIERLKDIPGSGIPVLMECHTKQFRNHYKDIQRFLEYIKIKYDDQADFQDLTSYYRNFQTPKDLSANKNLPDFTLSSAHV